MEPELADALTRLATALGLGLLVGMQRERAQSRLAGIRTFALITLFGALCGFLSQSLGNVWTLGFGALALASILVVGNIAKIYEGDASPGITTETAALLMYCIGAYVVVGYVQVAVVATGVVAVLLHFKEPLHGLIERVGENDVQAIMQFVLIALVILPALPDQGYGPYGVLNPREIWMMVVLIVGISLGGYVAFKFFGENAGTVLSGVLGGLISSTATTVSYARRSRESEEAGNHALVIMIASTVAFARIIAEVAVVAPHVVAQIALPMGAMLAWMTFLSAVWFLFGRGDDGGLDQPGNPAELKSALIFGLIYAAVLLLTAAAKDYFGARGLFLVAIISGLTDVDAITLSTARLSASGGMTSSDAWRVILIASLANLVFKAGAVAVLGSRRLLIQVAILFGAAVAGGVGLLLLWPDQSSLFGGP